MLLGGCCCRAGASAPVAVSGLLFPRLLGVPRDRRGGLAGRCHQEGGRTMVSTSLAAARLHRSCRRWPAGGGADSPGLQHTRERRSSGGAAPEMDVGVGVGGRTVTGGRLQGGARAQLKPIPEQTIPTVPNLPRPKWRPRESGSDVSTSLA